mgnify:FL=1
MITHPALYAVVLGLVAGGVVYLALSGFRQDRETRVLLRIMSAGIGAAAAWWGLNHPATIGSYTRGYLDPGQAVALAALGVVFLYWRFR